jgi:20S proteasome alpha/beta subunit
MMPKLLEGIDDAVAPKAADWGFKVSVCIAVICEGGKKIVCVTDNKVSFEDFSAENAVWKSYPIADRWTALYAGNDVEHAMPILRAAGKVSLEMPRKLKRRLTLTEVVFNLEEAYSEHLQSHIERKILRKHGLDTETFLKSGKLKITQEVYGKVWDRIDKTEFSLIFLACGFDEDGEAHLFVVNGQGVSGDHEALGYFAVGSGAPAAMSVLSFHRSRNDLSIFSTVGQATYVALTAKFMAESHGEVGTSTVVQVLSNDPERATQYVSSAGVATVRKLWNAKGSPRVPKDAEDLVSKLIFSQKDKSIEALEAVLGKPGAIAKEARRKARIPKFPRGTPRASS